MPPFLSEKVVKNFMAGKRAVAAKRESPEAIDYYNDVTATYITAAEGAFRLGGLTPKYLANPADLFIDVERLRLSFEPMRRLFSITSDDEDDDTSMYATLHTCLELTVRARLIPRGNEAILKLIKDAGVRAFQDHASHTIVARAASLNDDIPRVPFIRDDGGAARIFQIASEEITKAEKQVRDHELTGIPIRVSQYAPIASSSGGGGGGKGNRGQGNAHQGGYQQGGHQQGQSQPFGPGSSASKFGMHASQHMLRFGNRSCRQCDNKSFPRSSCYARMAQAGDDDDGDSRIIWCPHKGPGACPVPHVRTGDFIKSKLVFATVTDEPGSDYEVIVAPTKRPRPASGGKGDGSRGAGGRGRGKGGGRGRSRGGRDFRAGGKA